MIKPNQFVCYAGCVTRDLFNFIEFDDSTPQEKRKPALSVGFCNISDVFCPEIILDFNGFKESKYMSRNIEYDLTKVLLKKINESQAEWFIFDIINERIPIMEFEIEEYTGEKHVGYATKTPEFVNFWYYLIKKKCYKKMTKIRDYMFDELFTDLDYDNSLKKFCDAIKGKFGENRIIFNEVYLNNGYIDKAGIYREFDGDGYHIVLEYNKIERANAFLKKVADRIKDNLPNINVIQKPKYCISDSNHWLGLHPLHMKKSYYKYVCKCVDTIVKSKSFASQMCELSKLYSEQSEVNNDLFNVLRSQREFREKCDSERHLREKWQCYACSFKSVILNDVMLNAFKILLLRKLEINNWRQISIYGDTEITKVLCKALNYDSHIIAYIVENTENQINGIKTVNRGCRNYPDCDAMLIADIYNFAVIKAKLEKLNVLFPLVNAAEFIQSLKIMQEIDE